MANKTLTMLQIRRILQLLQEGRSKRKIAKDLSISRNTIDDYERKYIASGQSLVSLLGLSDPSLWEALNPPDRSEKEDNPRYDKLLEKVPYIIKDLKRPGVTRQLLWQEYKRENPEGYGYAQFCVHLNNYLQKDRATMHFEHKPGDYLQVDFAGSSMNYIHRDTGELKTCPVLVCVLPFSSKMYVEALPKASSEHLFAALGRCMSFLGGVPRNILFDNLKQVVTRSNRYEPSFSELSQQWALHYGTNFVAARVAKPKDKSSVEKGVDLAYKRVYAPLRNKEFYSLEELNYNIANQLDIHNHTNFQKRSHNRDDRFINEEKQCLGTLPSEPFTIKHVTLAKVQKNYHVILGEDWHQYSVPHEHIGKQVKIIYDTAEVEIYLGLKRIAIHRRSYRRHGYTTLPEHMPEKHQRYLEMRGWDAEYFIKRAARIGENTAWVIEKVLSSKAFPEQTYNACLGILSYEKKYSPQRLESACKRAYGAPVINYKIISNILKNNQDKQSSTQMEIRLPEHENIRGAGTYQ
jgi:transposase